MSKLFNSIGICWRPIQKMNVMVGYMGHCWNQTLDVLLNLNPFYDMVSVE